MIYSNTPQLQQYIKDYMKNNGIKQVDLARKLNRSRQSIYEILNKQQNISLDYLKEICNALGCDLDINFIKTDDATNQEETYYNVALAARNETLHMNKEQMEAFAKSANNAPNSSRNRDMF